MDDNCHVDPIQKMTTVEEQRTLTTALLTVWGMGRPNCAARVRNSLLLLHGVVDVEVALELGVAEVLFNPNLTNAPALIDAVARGRE